MEDIPLSVFGTVISYVWVGWFFMGVVLACRIFLVKTFGNSFFLRHVIMKLWKLVWKFMWGLYYIYVQGCGWYRQIQVFLGGKPRKQFWVIPGSFLELCYLFDYSPWSWFFLEFLGNGSGMTIYIFILLGVPCRLFIFPDYHQGPVDSFKYWYEEDIFLLVWFLVFLVCFSTVK